jgi:hypothetical protein
MKKTISIIALLIFASMSSLSLADKKEGVQVMFTGGEKQAKDNKKQKTFISAQKVRAKSVGQQKGRGRISPAPSLNDY